MAWDKMGKFRYFRRYRTREDGRQEAIHFGRGPEGVAESLKFQAEQQAKAALREMKRQDKLLDLKMQELTAMIRAEVVAEFEPKGYHWKDGQWRVKGKGRKWPTI